MAHCKKNIAIVSVAAIALSSAFVAPAFADVPVAQSYAHTIAAPDGIKNLFDSHVKSQSQTPVNIVAYTVQDNDTLSSVAIKFYGNAGDYTQIAAQNHISNADLIFPGQKLVFDTDKTVVVDSSVSSKTSSPSVLKPPPAYYHPYTAPLNYTASGVNWYKLAQCESGGNWAINTGNGFFGGLQFSEGTWLAYGGGQYAQYANNASAAQQIAIAVKVLAGQGPGAWPESYSRGSTCGF